MANTTIGGILIRIGASTKELEYDLKRAEKALQKTASKFSKLGNQLSVGLTLPIASAVAASFKMASDFEESLNKVRVAFGSSSESVEQFASTTLKNFGIARGSALDMAALFGDMATSMGLPQGEAAKLSTSLVSLAGDMASFKNIPLKEAETALSGVFTGETESLKRLGIVMLETNLNAFALTQGINKQVKEMTQAEKVALRYAYIMDVTKNAQGDFARTSGGAANQMRIFQESIKELGASFGNILLPAITPIISKINEWLQKFGQLSSETKTTIVVIAGLVAVVGPLLIVFSKVITAVGAIKIAMVGLAATSTGLTATLVTMGGPIAIGIAALAGAVYLLYKNWDYLNAESEVFRNSIIKIKLVFDQVVNLVMLLANGIKALGKSWLLFIGALTGEINPVTALKGIINEFKNVGKEFGNGVVEGFKSAEVAARLSRLSSITGIKSPSGDRAASYKKLSEKSKVAEVPSAFSGIKSISGGKSGGEKIAAKVPLIGALGTSKGIITDLESSIGAMQQRLTGGISTAASTIETLLNKSKNSIRDWAVETGQGFVDASGSFKAFKETIEQLGDVIKITRKNVLTGTIESLYEFKDLFNKAIEGIFEESAVAFGELLGNIASGDTGALSGFFNNILTILADFGTSLGKQMIAIGIGFSSLKKLQLNPLTAVAAGIGLIAISKIVKNIVSKGIPKLAIGTDYVNQDGLAYLHKGEAVVPADVNKGGYSGGKVGKQEIYGVLRGTDILLSNKYATTTINRLR